MRTGNLFTLTGLLLLSVCCSNVTVNDEIMYANKGMMGAISFHTLTSQSQEISFEDWMKLIRSEPLICSSVQTFGDAKKFYEKVCSTCNCCTVDTTAAVDTFFNNIDSAVSKTKVKK